MMEIYWALKLAHILGAAVLFGTGLGIAFFMFLADRRGNVAGIATTARTVVVADFLFTAPAVVLQPITGFALAHVQGLNPFSEQWLVVSLVLYVLVGLCWLPVVALQIRMRDVAIAAADEGVELPADYHRQMRRWFILGWPAFLGVIAIFWLMIVRPEFI